MQKTQGRTGAAATQFIDGIPAMLREHGVIATILLMGFLMRLFLADKNSYWLDEIYSVATFGIENKTGAEALERLTHDIHPPLYHLILYYWMALFGDSEVATRTLSNLYVVGATLSLYILTLKLYGSRVAIATALIFSLMYIPICYGLETRSYAQTLFLVSLSSLLLYYFLRQPIERLSWHALLRDGRLYGLVLTNLALLLTHFYNAFFVGAQAAFLFAYLLLGDRGRAPLSTAGKAVAIGATPLVLMLIAWGPVMARLYSHFKSKAQYVVAGLPPNPFSIFFDMVAQPNLAYPAFALGVIGVLLLLRLAPVGRAIYRGEAQLPGYFDFYFLVVALLPCVLAYLTFLISGHQRFSSRYFSFCTPPLAVLLALSADEAVRLIDGLASRASALSAHRYRTLAPLIVMLASLLVVLPGGYKAATIEKGDWRGIAKAIVNFVESEPKKSFIVYETTFRHYPTLDYYLARFSPTLRVQGVIQRLQERSRKPFNIDAQAEKVGGHDYLVLAFTHHKTRHFPKALAALAKRYQVSFSLLHDGRGFIVYKVH